MSMATKIKPIVGVALLLIMTCSVNWISRDVGHIVIQDIDYKVKQMSSKRKYCSNAANVHAPHVSHGVDVRTKHARTSLMKCVKLL